jgi:hypothetical protein
MVITASAAITPTRGRTEVSATPASITATPTGTTVRRPARSASPPATVDATDPRA